MVAQRQELAVREFNFTPTTLEEAKQYATIFASSGLCPESYKGRPNDILVVWQMGSELGLDKMQALRTLGCINGMPFAYGDGLLALVKSHRDFMDMKEWFEGDIKDGTLTAYCMIMRRDKEAVTQKFSIEDAKTAGLWQKKGVWQQYPTRMLQHRARGFAARDAFPDALFGIRTQEEVQSIVDAQTVVELPKPTQKGTKGLEEALGIQEEPPIIEGEVILEPVQTKLDELKELISSRKVTKGSITVTLKKFGVAILEELTDEMIDKWSNHLKTRESK